MLITEPKATRMSAQSQEKQLTSVDGERSGAAGTARHGPPGAARLLADSGDIHCGLAASYWGYPAALAAGAGAVALGLAILAAMLLRPGISGTK